MAGDLYELRTAELTVAVAPRLGGRILQLRDRGSGREFLWMSERRAHRPHPPGTSFDDVFAGGWDELLPNDEPENWRQRRMPDHGELWTTPADVASGDREHVAMVANLARSGLRLRKCLALSGRELIISYTVENVTSDDVDFQLKLHPALRISDGARIALPRGPAVVTDAALSRAATDFVWPNAIGRDGTPVSVDACRVSRRRGSRCTSPIRRWGIAACATTGRTGALRSASSTGWPSRFDQAGPAGRLRRLTAGASFSTTVRCVVGSPAVVPDPCPA